MGLFEDIAGAVKGVPSTVEGWAGDVGHALTHSDDAGGLAGSLGGILKSVPSDLSWDAHKLGLMGGDAPSPPGQSMTPRSTGAGITSPYDSVPSPGTPGAPPSGKGGPAQPGQTPGEASTAASDISNQAMDSLIKEYSTALGAVQPYESGQAGQRASGQATTMGQQIAAGGASAQNAYSGIGATQNADYQKMAAADAQGSQGVTQALGDLKSADATALSISPYAGLLTALGSGASYRAETQPTSGASPFGTSLSAEPQFLQDAYALGVGNYGLSASGATTPGAGTSSGATSQTTPSTTTSGPSGGP